MLAIRRVETSQSLQPICMRLYSNLACHASRGVCITFLDVLTFFNYILYIFIPLHILAIGYILGILEGNHISQV